MAKILYHTLVEHCKSKEKLLYSSNFILRKLIFYFSLSLLNYFGCIEN